MKKIIKVFIEEFNNCRDLNNSIKVSIISGLDAVKEYKKISKEFPLL